MTVVVSGNWTRVRTLGRGASGAEVFLAADEVSGELFAVKSSAAAGAEMLRREQEAMSNLRSPHVVPCIGGRGARDGSYQLFLEFAPGGSLADEVARNGGRLEERDVRRYAADVARGLAYVHGTGLVHGDVKARNVVIGADGRAKLADFGCARMVAGSARPFGGTPAFMAPEVARGEEQGPAADVWALGCTVIEMATGRAPWSDVDDVLAAVHRIGYTDAVPEVPPWLSAEAKDFLVRCLARRPSHRSTAAQLLEHPFVASADGCDAKLEVAKGKWVSPKSTLDAALWESDTDDEDDDVSQSTAERIKALACPTSALPDWDSDDGWIDVVSTPNQASNAAAVPVEDTTGADGGVRSDDEVSAEVEPLDIDVDSGDSAHNAGETDASPEHERHLRANSPCNDEVSCKLQCTRNNATHFVLAQVLLCSSLSLNSEILLLSKPLCFLRGTVGALNTRVTRAHLP
ncbi:mitogen-activated protein kinase kinase kinase 17-like [Phragmites australis]|uniref:mitogen-activated protein kinase kinase kinase 17-like n=1 Tax=Phragmites australis TaxID=29695 RepID=UPI002D79AB5A|nr:mitogen-activated protein kinase kinase kinase 17-like [Phragmites australis]